MQVLKDSVAGLSPATYTDSGGQESCMSPVLRAVGGAARPPEAEEWFSHGRKTEELSLPSPRGDKDLKNKYMETAGEHLNVNNIWDKVLVNNLPVFLLCSPESSVL